MLTALAALVSFAVTAITGKLLIPWLRRLKAGQEIREDGPTWHNTKAGTPTMGGLMFIAGIFTAIVVVGWRGMLRGDLRHLYLFGFSAIFGAIGFLDDFEKVVHHRNLGLTALQKFLLQLVAAVAFLSLMRYEHLLTPNLYLPFFQTHLVLSWPVYLIFTAFVIVGTVNAVNITDGVDGLASAVTVPIGLFFALVAVWWPGLTQIGVYAGALVGGLLGFLLYNLHPAHVFMGDTGSLFLGGTVAALAFACDMPMILLFIGVVYIGETMSDLLQVGYFKLTQGKRLFRMAPLHHHLELCGWSERKLVAVFTAVSVLGCLIAALGVRNRYHF